MTLTLTPSDGLASAPVTVYYHTTNSSTTPTQCGAGTVSAAGSASVACTFPTVGTYYVYTRVTSPTGTAGSLLCAAATVTVSSTLAAVMNGNNYIQLNTEIVLTTYTVEFWIKSSDTAEHGISGKSGNRYGQNVRNNKLYSANGQNSTATIVDGTWHHCALVFSGGSTQYIIDGNMDYLGTFDGGNPMVPM